MFVLLCFLDVTIIFSVVYDYDFFIIPYDVIYHDSVHVMI